MLLTELDNRQYVKKMRQSGQYENETLAISFQLTAECNFRCSYCYETKHKKSVSYDDASIIIDKLFDIENNLDYWGTFVKNKTKQNISFDFFGGECTLEIDTMEKLCQHFYDHCLSNKDKYAKRLENWEIVVETNGSTLKTPKVAAFIKKWRKWLIISMTIDGSKQFHDSCRVFKDSGLPTWDIVVENYLWLKENYPDVHFQTKGTISHDNLPLLYDTYLGYKKLGIDPFGLSVGMGLDWETEDVAIAKKQFDLIINDMLLEDRDTVCCAHLDANTFKEDILTFLCAGIGSCGATGAHITVSPHGRLYTCSQFAEPTQHSQAAITDFCIGTVTTGIDSAKYDKVSDLILSSIDSDFVNSKKCLACSYNIACENCPAFNYLNAGDVNKSEKRHCAILKVQQAAAVKYAYLREKAICEKNKKFQKN